MKLKNIYLYYLLILFLPLYFSCGSNDDDGGNGASSFTETCCQIPHLEACIGGAKVFVPNAFTPNSDGFNDLFYPFGDSGVEKIVSFKVFNGNETLFESADFQPNSANPSIVWDGKLPDGTIEEGVYTYTISIENISGESATFDGAVCLRSPFGFPCVDFENHCAYGSQHDGNGGFDFNLPSFEDCQ